MVRLQRSPLSRRIVITGTTRGLGQALAEELRQRGHLVAGCGTSAAPPEQVDVADPNQVEQWARAVLAKWQAPPDLLINSAGITTDPDPIWAQPPEALARVLRVNVAGVHNVLRAFLPAMVELQQGVIINISSDWGRSGAPMVAPYCTSKWAVEGLTACLALELPTGMAAVSLDPGTINTDMLRFTFGPGAEEYPSPESWRARAADFVLSLGPQHNGQALTIWS
ncbi:SDR family NAD(P)-dependent oxidoreductase [bacterium]|nr:SDR family NAD(P)-dependent oxidoreductase [bacterium]